MIASRNRWYRDALAAPHNAYSRIEIWRSGIQVDELVYREPGGARYARATPVFLGGSIRATLGSRVTRTLTMSVPEYLYPRRSTDLLNPYGNEIRAFRGIRYGNDSRDEFPVFVGPIMRAKPPRQGEVTIEASDVTLRVSGAGFLSPLPSQVGDLVTDEYERLVLDAYPAATFGTHSSLTDLVPALSYDTDRGQALDSLAGTATAFWYALADGRFVIRSIPWSVAPTSAAIVLTDGAGGTLQAAYPDQNAADLFNRVLVLSDRADGGPPLWASADDDDPTSPTWIGGPFGVRARSVRVTGATNQGQLLSVAKTLIARTRTLTESWSITCVPDAAIELGDPLDVEFRGAQALQLVAGFTMPLDPVANMSIEGRGLNTSLEDS